MNARVDQEKVFLSEMDKARRLFSKPIHAKEDRNPQPSASQGLSTAKPRSSHSVCTHWAHSPCPILSAGAEPLSPKDIAGSNIMSTKSADFS